MLPFLSIVAISVRYEKRLVLSEMLFTETLPESSARFYHVRGFGGVNDFLCVFDGHVKCVGDHGFNAGQSRTTSPVNVLDSTGFRKC